MTIRNPAVGRVEAAMATTAAQHHIDLPRAHAHLLAGVAVSTLAGCDTAAPVAATSQQQGPRVRSTRYEVSILPEDFPDGDRWTLVLEARAGGMWVVRNRGRFLGADGVWSFGFQWMRDGHAAEPVTEAEMDDYNAGEDKWRAEHRFDLETALRLARKAAPHVTVGGLTAAQVLARRENGEAS